MALDHSAIAAALRQSLKSVSGGRVYGVVDAARCVELAYEAKLLFGKEIRSLFLPEVQAALADVAPYLIPIDTEGGYLDNWARRLGTSAGILFVSAAGEDVLYQHLRKIFVVEDEEKQEYFFRYYDPRVLRTFLPTCSSDQLIEFFGPVEAFALEDEDCTASLILAVERGRLSKRRVSLHEAAADHR